VILLVITNFLIIKKTLFVLSHWTSFWVECIPRASGFFQQFFSSYNSRTSSRNRFWDFYRVGTRTSVLYLYCTWNLNTYYRRAVVVETMCTWTCTRVCKHEPHIIPLPTCSEHVLSWWAQLAIVLLSYDPHALRVLVLEVQTRQHTWYKYKQSILQGRPAAYRGRTRLQRHVLLRTLYLYYQ
jgi:hypothetical protein